MFDEKPEPFDPSTFIDEIVEEMGMQNEDPVKLSGLKEAMMEALCRKIFDAASEWIEDEVIDLVMTTMDHETDVEYLMQELVQTSPGAQMGMILALDEFKTQTLEAFQTLKI